MFDLMLAEVVYCIEIEATVYAVRLNVRLILDEIILVVTKLYASILFDSVGF